MVTFRVGSEALPEDLGLKFDELPTDLGVELTDIDAQKNHQLAVIAADLAVWTYSALMPGEEDAIILSNDTGKPLTLHVDELDQTITLANAAFERVETTGDCITVKLFTGNPFESCCTIGDRRQELRCGRRYRLVSGRDGQPTLEASSGLPEGLNVKAVHHSVSKNIAAWSAFTSSDTVWIAFKGTQTLVDALVDVAVVTYSNAPHGLTVQGTMWLSLTQRKNHTLNAINDLIAQLQRESPKLQKVVICGHSLGGSYAILAGLYRLHLKLPVTSIISFGGPQVVIPDWNLPIWYELNNITSTYIHSWDVVPRLPSCPNWLFDILPRSLPSKVGVSLGGLHVGFKAGGDIINHFKDHQGVFDSYDAVGTIIFIRRGSRKVIALKNSIDGRHRKLLCAEPDEPGGFILEHHAAHLYSGIISRLQ